MTGTLSKLRTTLELLYPCVHTLLEVNQSLSHSRVEGYHGAGAVSLRTYGTELKAVAGEGERRGAVTVGIVYEQFRYRRDVELQSRLGTDSYAVILGILQMVENLCELLAEERADDSRWCLVSTQTVCVGGTHDRGLEQTVMFIYAHQCLHYEGNETQVAYLVLGRCMEQYAVVC